MISRDTKLIENKITSLGIQYHYTIDDAFVLLCRRSEAHKHIRTIEGYAESNGVNISVTDFVNHPLITVES